MKKFLTLWFCLVLLIGIVGCGRQDTEEVIYELKDNYYAVGDYELITTPYLHLTSETETFMMGSGAIYSFAIHGTYEIESNQLIATGQDSTYTFEIRDNETLVFLSGDNPPIGFGKNAVFAYREELA